MEKYTIVMVENDEDERMFMREGFEEFGQFTVLDIVEDGNALFEWLENHAGLSPDLILTDLSMPGKNGYDILKWLKASLKFSGIPVIITSTSSAPVSVKKCLDLGAVEYLLKPDTFTEYIDFARRLHEMVTQNEWARQH